MKPLAILVTDIVSYALLSNTARHHYMPAASPTTTSLDAQPGLMATTGNNRYRHSSATVRMCTLAVKTPSANLKKHCIQTAVFPRTRRDCQLGDGAHAPINRTSNADIASQSRTVWVYFILLELIQSTCGQATHCRFTIWNPCNSSAMCNSSSRRIASPYKGCCFSPNSSFAWEMHGVCLLTKSVCRLKRPRSLYVCIYISV